MVEFRSWGRYPDRRHRDIISVDRGSEPPDLSTIPGLLLPIGYGRSYGDSCLNEGGVLLDTRPMRQVMEFDESNGTLRCEAGATLAQLLERIVPRGWFLPVVPGTKHVSVGGAIANDIHGKNHHRAGSFGCHVDRFGLLRSDGERLVCSMTENHELFRATIGGLGLTGLILWADLRLARVPSSAVEVERIRFSSLEEFAELSDASASSFEYTVAWIDCLARAEDMGRGVFFRGSHATGEAEPARRRPTRLRVPFDAPSGLLNPFTIGAFNALYYRFPISAKTTRVVPFDRFFFPLDAVEDWNRLYGSRGLVQYQCVVPRDVGLASIRRLLRVISDSREASFLAVLKEFGAVRSPGLLSFPRPGMTLALDLPFRGSRTLEMLEDLDRIVREVGGAVYPAKDARMSAESFQRYFPEWREFASSADPRFSSSFWRRVTVTA